MDLVKIQKLIIACIQDIEIKFPDGPLQLDKYMSQGQQAGEELLPEEAKASGKLTISFSL